MAEPGTWRGKTGGAYFSAETGLTSAATEQAPIQAEGTEKQPTSLPRHVPGSAMLLKVLGGTNAERRYTVGLSRSGASPYQHLEDNDEYENAIFIRALTLSWIPFLLW
jgi:hypothetical protein